jgi:hypothetical protein
MLRKLNCKGKKIHTYENCSNSTEKTIQCDILDNTAELNDIDYCKKIANKFHFVEPNLRDKHVPKPEGLEHKEYPSQ